MPFKLIPFSSPNARLLAYPLTGGVAGGPVLFDASRAADEALAGQTAQTQAGDVLAYDATGYFATAISGGIVGPLTSGVAIGTTMYFKHDLGGGAIAPTPSATVTGTPATTSAPTLISSGFGEIWPVEAKGFVPAPATVPASGTTPLTVYLVTTGSTQTRLAEQTDDAPVGLVNETTGGFTKPTDPVCIIPGAAMAFTIHGNLTPGPALPGGGFENNLVLAGDVDGNVIGPAGSSGTSTTSIAWELSQAPATVSPSTTVSAVRYKTFLSTITPTAGGVPPGNLARKLSIPLSAPPNSVYYPFSAADVPGKAMTVNVDFLAQWTPPYDLGQGPPGSDIYLTTDLYTLAASPANAFPNALAGPFAAPLVPISVNDNGIFPYQIIGSTVHRVIGPHPIYFQVRDKSFPHGAVGGATSSTTLVTPG